MQPKWLQILVLPRRSEKIDSKKTIFSFYICFFKVQEYSKGLIVEALCVFGRSP